MAKNTVEESTITKVEPCMTDNGTRIEKMDSAFTPILMGKDIKETG